MATGRSTVLEAMERLFWGALPQAPRARLRSDSPSGTFGNRLYQAGSGSRRHPAELEPGRRIAEDQNPVKMAI
jgi:hypothetical protein